MSAKQMMEARFGGRWRYTSALRQRFYVRRKLVRWMEAQVAAAQVELEVVAAAMDRLGLSPDRFYRELGQGRDPLANVALDKILMVFHFYLNLPVPKSARGAVS